MTEEPATLPFVSVIVPTRDRPDLLEVALRSICDQSYPGNRFEVIVCEDGPASSSKAVVDGFPQARDSGRGPQVRWIRSSGGGVNSARNCAIAEASGDPIVLTDDDVLAPPNWLQEVVEGCLRHPSAGCAGGPVRIKYEGRRPRVCPHHATGAGEVELEVPEGPIEVVRLLGANLALRRFALEQQGAFDEGVIVGSGADWEWQGRYLKSCGEIVYLPRARMLHRRTPEMAKLSRLLSLRYRRGFNKVIYRRQSDARGSGRKELQRLGKHMVHALRYRCAGGLLEAAFDLGLAVGLLLDRFGRHPGTSRFPSIR